MEKGKGKMKMKILLINECLVMEHSTSFFILPFSFLTFSFFFFSSYLCVHFETSHEVLDIANYVRSVVLVMCCFLPFPSCLYIDWERWKEEVEN